MAHADWIIDIGPGAGHDGGTIVFEGTPAELVAAKSTLTGQHLAAYVGRLEPSGPGPSEEFDRGGGDLFLRGLTADAGVAVAGLRTVVAEEGVHAALDWRRTPASAGRSSREASIFAGVLRPSLVPETDRTCSPDRPRSESSG